MVTQIQEHQLQQGSKDRTPRLAINNIMIRQAIKQPAMPIMFQENVETHLSLFINSLVSIALLFMAFTIFV